MSKVKRTQVRWGIKMRYASPTSDWWWVSGYSLSAAIRPLGRLAQTVTFPTRARARWAAKYVENNYQTRVVQIKITEEEI